MSPEAIETIHDGVVVTFDYVIHDEGGEVLDRSSTSEPGVYLHGADNIAPGLEAALVGASVGDTVSVEVPPDQGFGVRDDRAPVVVSRDLFEPGLELSLGMQCLPEGDESESTALWVVDFNATEVTLDFNHPLAGKHCVYEVTVTALRAAWPDELAEGGPRQG